MSRRPLLLLVFAACSGDDSHHQQTLRPVPPPVVAVTPDAGVAAVVEAPKPAPLTEAMAQLYFTTGDAGDGAQAFALHKWKAARTSFDLARAAAKEPVAIARLELMVGLCDEELGDWSDALGHLTAALPQLPLLADYIEYHAARSAYSAHKLEVSRELAAKVAPDSIVGSDTQMLLGDLSRAAGDRAATAKFYQGYLDKHPDGPHRSETRFRLAEALEHDQLAAALDLDRKITIEDPLSSWATKAHERIAALAPDQVAKLDTLSGPEHITQGKVYFDAMRNPESEKAFTEALDDPKLTAADKCTAAYNRAQSHFKTRDRKGSAPLFDDSAAACKAASNTDLEIKSNYQAGRSYSYFGDHDTAIKRYQAAETIDPKHSYADDAMLREGEEWASLNDGKQVEAVLSALPTKFPDGDNVTEALWRLGWRAWHDKQYDDAIKWWKQQVAAVPHDDSYIGEGEALYWLGRAYAAKHDKKDAIASWQATVREYPAAYYALLAFNRLREVDPKVFTALVEEISTPPKDYDPKAPSFTFKPRVEWAQPGFLRAMELMRLGLGEPAEAELKKVGLTAPADRKRVDDPDKIEKLWAMAFLYDRAGGYATSHWPTRWHILDYRRQWPVGVNRARWLIAYPKAYWELLTRHAELNKVPIAMQIGIVREESAFDPLDESYANAIGLTQMIPSTAHDFSKGTGIDPTRENLRDPEKNVTIGSRFLGFLWKHWNGFTLLVPPSYNAGPAGVGRMLKARGTWDADEFVEGIVDDQARNYTKRVLGTFFTYTWLYQHEVPEIPNTIPTALLPKK